MPKYIRFTPTKEQLTLKETTLLAGLTHIYHLGCVDVHGQYDTEEDLQEDTIDATKILASETIIDALVEQDMDNAQHINEQSISVLLAWMNYGPHILYEDKALQVVVPIEYVCPQMLEKTTVTYEYLESLPEEIA